MSFFPKPFHLLIGFSLFSFGCSQTTGGQFTDAHSLCMSQSQAQESLENNIDEHQDFIIKMKAGAQALPDLEQDLQQAADINDTTGAQSINRRLIHLKIPKNSRAVDVVSKYIRSNDIEFIEPDYEIFAVDANEDSSEATALGTKQWAHAVVESEKAWEITKGSPSVLVGVIDTGIDPTHPDLKDAISRNSFEATNGTDDDHNGYIDDIIGWNFVSNNNSPLADDTRSYHGTHVSGTIAGAQNATMGTSGQAPGVKILPLKYLNSNSSGVTSNAIKAIDYAISKKVRILSNSWGSFNKSSALENAIIRAQKAGILFVAAAGNGDSSGRGVNLDRMNFYPAGYAESNIVSVAASNSSNQLSVWSNFGTSRVDLAAPGVSIYSTRNNNQYAYLSGTSMAAPLVSGVAALVLSVRPDFTYQLVKQALMASVDKYSSMSDKVASGGRINAYKAVLFAKNYTGAIPAQDTSGDPELDPEPNCR